MSWNHQTNEWRAIAYTTRLWTESNTNMNHTFGFVRKQFNICFWFIFDLFPLKRNIHCRTLKHLRLTLSDSSSNFCKSVIVCSLHDNPAKLSWHIYILHLSHGTIIVMVCFIFQLMYSSECDLFLSCGSTTYSMLHGCLRANILLHKSSHAFY